jgi:ketosteroid isomerase-like protein
LAEHPNVGLVRSGFEAMAAGDMEAVIGMYSPELKYYGYDATARPREFASRDEFFAMVMGAMSYCDEFSMDLVNAYPVGDSLVMAHVHAHRRSRESQETIDDDFAMVFRIDDGQVTHGVDLIGPAFVDFWRRASGS